MRIGVLEWASCGGRNDSAELADSICIEGWAMCRAALLSLIRAEHHAVALVDARCAIDPLVSGFSADQLELIEYSQREPIETQWQRVYATCDYTLVIAPECQRILERLLRWCTAQQLRTCNCGLSFVRLATDKWRTARFFEQFGVPHPPTQLLGEAQQAWTTGLASVSLGAAGSHADTWAIKPRDGVGCEGLMRVTANQLRQGGGFAGCVAAATDVALEHLDPSRWIVQPWLPGQALSRSAIVDLSGRPHWLPVTQQSFSPGAPLTYLGGSVEPQLAEQIPALDEPLMQSLRALGAGPCGWVGIDFLYDAGNLSQPITIIEVNPRLTTSFVGLAHAGAPQLAAAIVAAAQGEPVALPPAWQPVRFTAAGDSQRS